MEEFLRENAIAVILVPIGVFLVIQSYAARAASKKSGRYISGVPVFGGIFIFAGFLFSQYKILCLLCLVDYGVWGLVYGIIADNYRRIKFKGICRKNGFTKEVKNEKKKISLRYNGEEIEWLKFAANVMFDSRKIKAAYAVCMNEEGEMFLVLDRKKIGCKTEILPFENGKREIEGIKYGEESVSIVIRIEEITA